MKSFTIVVVLFISIFSFSTSAFSAGVPGTLDNFCWADAEGVIYESAYVAMKDAGIVFYKGEGLQRFFVSETLKFAQIPGDGKVYDGMQFMTGLIAIEPNTMRIPATLIVTYLIVAEQNGVLYFIAGSEVVDSKDDPDIAEYIEAVDNHLWKDMMIEEIK